MTQWWRVVLVAVGLLGACASSSTKGGEPALVAVPTEMTAQCQSTADVLGFAIPCPTMLPAGSHPTVFVGGNCPGRAVWIGPACGSASNGAFASIEFERPSPDVPGHLVIEAAPTPLSPADAVSYPLPATDRIVLKPRGQVQVAGQQGDVFEVAEESATAFGGHTVVVWTSNGHTFVAGLHGHDPASVSMNESIIGAIEMVGPK